MIDIRQSENYANYLSSLGWIVERINDTNYFIKTFSIVGSVLKIQRPETFDPAIINKLARKYRSFQIIIEPKNVQQAKKVEASGYNLSKNPYLPSKTLQIDLSEIEEKIFNSLKKDARAAIKRGGAFFIKEYSTPDEIKIFREGWKKSVNFKRFVPPADQLINLRMNFSGNHSMFLASHNISGSIIGGVIFTTSSHKRSNYISYYWQAFTNNEGRSTLSQYSLLYHGILWAKRVGCKLFDFEGIYDPRFPNKNWLGFTHFKRSFGGYEVEYPGCFIKNRLPFGL